MADDKSKHPKPERPRSEPEIIPPDRGEREPLLNPHMFSSSGGPQRIYVARVGPLGFTLLLLVVAVLAAVMLIAFVGALLIWLPVVAALLVLGAVLRFLLR